MAKTSREVLREKIAAIGEDRRSQEYGMLREVAAREPQKVGEALGELPISPAHGAHAPPPCERTWTWWTPRTLRP